MLARLAVGLVSGLIALPASAQPLAGHDFAATPTGTAAVYGTVWGDPYQSVIVAGGAGSNYPSPGSGVNLVSALFGQSSLSQSSLINGQLIVNSDPYAAPPTYSAAPLPGGASPVSATLGNAPTPILGGPLFQGGPVYNSLQNFDPLFPRFRNRIDSRLYLRGEYLLWDVSGMESPPLVSTSVNGTPQDIAAVLGEPGASILFGGNELNDGSVSGFLLSGGFWVTPDRTVAIETEFFQLGQLDDGYNGSSSGSVILGRPFFDIVQGQETAQLVSYPGLVGGSVSVSTESELRSFLFDARVSLCPAHGPCCQQCGMQEGTDWIIGYRNIRLRDELGVEENLVSQLTSAPGTVAASDRFRTTNQFNGLQLGLMHRRLLQRAWLESSCKVAIGNMEQTQDISGGTTYNEQGVVDSFSGGLLAQRTNIGNHTRDEFSMVPELGIRMGLRLTERLHASIGYSVLYLPNVVRAAEQIDRDINPGLIPEESDPLTGALRPRVLWVQSDYLAHGLHFGGELHF